MVAFQFLLRSTRVLRRSFMASLMMFGFPVMFFFIFGVLINSDFDLPDISLAINTDTVDESTVLAFSSMDGVEVEHQSFVTLAISEELEAGGFSAYIDNSQGTITAYIDSAQERTMMMLLAASQSNFEQNDENSLGPFQIERIRVESQFVRFAIPGLFAMALLQLMIFATAMPLLTERAAGTWRLISTLPISPIEIMIGEGGTRLIVAALQMILLYSLTIFLVDITLVENVLPFILICLVSSVMCIILGFAIGGIISDERWGIHVLTFLNLYMLFFGDIFSPVSEIEGLGLLTLVNPITYVSNAIRWSLTGIEGSIPPMVCVVAMFIWSIAALIAVRYFSRYETVTTQ